MPAIAHNQTATLQNVNGSSIPASWRKQFDIRPSQKLTIFIVTEKKEEEKPKAKYQTPEQIEKWADSLPTRKATPEEEEAIREADADEGIVMTAKEFENRYEQQNVYS